MWLSAGWHCKKTKQLHKQLDDMKPNAIFSSVVKRPYDEQIDNLEAAKKTSSVTSPFNQIKTGATGVSLN